MRPYFASSHARSRYSTDGEIDMIPVCGSPGIEPSQAFGFGSSDRPRLTLTEPDRLWNRSMSRTTSAGRCASPTRSL
jgi:hypothetical protein